MTKNRLSIQKLTPRKQIKVLIISQIQENISFILNFERLTIFLLKLPHVCIEKN